MITVYYIIITRGYPGSAKYIKMADKAVASANAVHEEYKASGFEITMTRTIILPAGCHGTLSKASPAPYPKKARGEKVRVEYCYCSVLVYSATTVTEQVGMP